MSQYGFCNLAMMPVRSEAQHRSEMINMLLFGDIFEILETKEAWHQIKTCHDDYIGWVNIRKIIIADEIYRFRDSNSQVCFCGDAIFKNENSENPIEITFGSKIHYKDGNLLLPNEQEFPCTINLIVKDTDIIQIAQNYLGTPYLWGGRSIFGIDCSGFTQMVYRIQGIALPRDAWQQAEKGEAIEKLENAEKGDLAFFAEKEKITHVGILTGDGHIIHASGKVRKEKVDEVGIFSEELQKYTLSVKVIKRYI